MNVKKVNIALALLAIPVAGIGLVNFIVAVNMLLGWRDSADGAPLSVPVFLVMWAIVSWSAIATGGMKKGSIVLIHWFNAFAICLPFATLFQGMTVYVSDPIFPLGSSRQSLGCSSRCRWCAPRTASNEKSKIW